LGTNPQYKDKLEKRILEVYVLHDFGEHFFYGSKVEVVLRKLIRFEGKYRTFGVFIQAIHNDIHVIR
jgi:FAD synthase